MLRFKMFIVCVCCSSLKLQRVIVTHWAPGILSATQPAVNARAYRAPTAVTVPTAYLDTGASRIANRASATGTESSAILTRASV